MSNTEQSEKATILENQEQFEPDRARNLSIPNELRNLGKGDNTESSEVDTEIKKEIIPARSTSMPSSSHLKNEHNILACKLDSDTENCNVPSDTVWQLNGKEEQEMGQERDSTIGKYQDISTDEHSEHSLILNKKRDSSADPTIPPIDQSEYSVFPEQTITTLENGNSTEESNETETEKSMEHIPSNAEGTYVYVPSEGTVRHEDKISKPNGESPPQPEYDVKNGETGLNFQSLAGNDGSTPKGPEEINILLLGETGVGKTTFINSLLNNIHFSTFKEIMEKEPKILIDTAFTLSDEDQKITRVEAAANYGNWRMEKENESFATNGESSTQRPIIHEIYWEDEGYSKNIKIIDTPGVNDTRGVEQDKKNFNEIFKEIDQLSQLHAICILLKPNEARFTASFRYCFDNLLARLHKSATDNILFCFTNTRSTLYRPGDTLTTLHMYLKQIEKEKNIFIRADRNNIFCFDNDCFRYKLAVGKGVCQRTKEMDDIFAEGWNHNVKETIKFLRRAQSLPTHNVQDTVSLNLTMRLLTELARPLAEIARVHLVNMKLTEDHIMELKKYNPSEKNIVQIRRNIVVLKFDKLSQPRTICTSSKCTEWKKINAYEVVPIYGICHENCRLNEFREGDKNALYSCIIFRQTDNYYNYFTKHCCNCGCKYTHHKHTFYKQSLINEIVEDKRAIMEQLDAEMKAEEILKEIEECEDSKRAMEQEHDLIRDFCAEAAVFIERNSMKSSGDPYKIVLDEIIVDEESKAAITGNNDMTYEIQTLQVMYSNRVGHIRDEIAKNRRDPVTSDEIQKALVNLSLQRICGAEIKNLRRICEEIITEHPNS